MKSPAPHRFKSGPALALIALAGSALGGCSSPDEKMAAQLTAAESAATRAEDAAARAERAAHLPHPAPALAAANPVEQDPGAAEAPDQQPAIEPTPIPSPGFDLAPAPSANSAH